MKNKPSPITVGVGIINLNTEIKNKPPKVSLGRFIYILTIHRNLFSAYFRFKSFVII